MTYVVKYVVQWDMLQTSIAATCRLGFGLFDYDLITLWRSLIAFIYIFGHVIVCIPFGFSIYLYLISFGYVFTNLCQYLIRWRLAVSPYNIVLKCLWIVSIFLNYRTQKYELSNFILSLKNSNAGYDNIPASVAKWSLNKYLPPIDRIAK